MTIDSWIIIALISAALVAAFRPVGTPVRTAVRTEDAQADHSLRGSLGLHD